ncbi:MAG: ATP-binding cassette domain-containing protein [Veillonella sp.]|uniref:ABC transporter ATP-binding protein n=1 Tax=Veillonella sp. TaxID=1926307 RepID=UPI00257E2EBC|nr:ATP-binding cassette domain-containing protein [Veillonella sp.]MBS7012956.1 ATP-binding cassette domain-containing protein [Veillonella sp.]
MIQVEHVCKQYTNHHHTVHAVNDVSFSVAPNERVGIAGGSGSGKSTLLRLIAMLEKTTSGTIQLFGEDVTSIQNHRDIYKFMQMMFQNPLAIIPPRMNLEAFMLEPYINYGLMDEASAKEDICKWIQHVDLPESIVQKYPHEVSGGQLQRVVLARIMLMHPKLVLFDEPTSALDAVNQKLVLDLLQKLYQEQPFGYVFVSHDIGLLQAVTDRIMVMKDGHIVEIIESKRLKEAVHPYTKALVEASE